MITFHLITLFPEALTSYVSASIVGRAVKQKKIKLKFYNPRDFVTKPKSKLKKGEWFYRQTDARPYGGGPGMVMMAEPILRAVESIRSKIVGQKSKIIILSPAGQTFTNTLADKTSRTIKHLILVCGHYEGIDARVKKILKATEWSIGPYVLTGGELPALIILDAITRRLPGVLGKDESIEERRSSIASDEVYTRPELIKWQGRIFRVPPILLSGHHHKIEKWKKERGQDKTVDNSIDAV